MSEDETVANLVSKILGELGEDVEREVSNAPPSASRRRCRYLTSGYDKEPRRS